MKTPTGTSETAATSPPKPRVGPFTFFKQVQQEARKVTWTSRQETIYATIMTLVMVVVAAAFFYMADALVTIGVRFLTGTESL
jgi:preprotein translocase subunit SecE